MADELFSFSDGFLHINLKSLNEQSGKVLPAQVDLRDHDFETAECEYCKYFISKTTQCKVLEIKVDSEQVCDAYQGAQNKFKPFSIAEKDFPAFARGMQREQPYKHIVTGGIKTPAGFLILIQDTMTPSAHKFSLDMPFSSEHLAREHHWTQKEIDKLIQIGKGG